MGRASLFRGVVWPVCLRVTRVVATSLSQPVLCPGKEAGRLAMEGKNTILRGGESCGFYLRDTEQNTMDFLHLAQSVSLACRFSIVNRHGISGILL